MSIRYLSDSLAVLTSRMPAGRCTVPLGMPTTRFGGPTYDQNGEVDYTFMNWIGIAQLEPNKVVDWVKLLRRHERKEILLVLNGIFETFKNRQPGIENSA